MIILSLMIVISIMVLYLKRRQKAFNLTSNIAYTGQCIKFDEDIDYYSIFQPPTEISDEMKDEHSLATRDAANESTKTMLCDEVVQCHVTEA